MPAITLCQQPLLSHSAASPSPKPLGARRVQQPTTCRRVHLQAVAGGKVYIDPVEKHAAAFAPATVANLGPGFDWLGCAVEGEGDTVIATVLPDRPGEVVVEAIEGDGGRLSMVAAENCAGIGAIEVMKQLGNPSCGVSLKLNKGLPLGSGMGSSAASAAAGAAATNALFGSPLSREQLVLAGLVSEAFVSGYHADNIAPAVLGNFVLVKTADPLDIIQMEFGAGQDLWFTLVNPKFEAPTKEMRAVLPSEVPFKSMINNSLQGGALVASILNGDPIGLGQALDSDCIIEPTRGPLIPGFAAVKEAAKAAGAYGCTISGAGPTCVAVVSDPDLGYKVGEAMGKAFEKYGKLEVNTIQVVKLCKQGTRLL